ncbi:MAG TPA: HAD family hydrolase [Pirellulales bacterium]|nr:HAD family hydrolase [Pirellulales bacterium]
MARTNARNVRERIESGFIRAAIFDVYGTLVDWVPTIRRFLVDFAREHFSQEALRRVGQEPTGPDSVIDADALLQKYDEVRRRVQIEHPTALYPAVLRQSLDEFAIAFGIEPVPDESRRFAEGPRTWPAFHDSHAVLCQLREKGLVVAAVSNIDNDSLRHTCDHALEFRFDEVVTAEDVGAYKPNPRLLGRMLSLLGKRNVRTDQILLIAQSLYSDHKPTGKLYPEILRVHVNRPGSILGLTVEGVPAPDLEVSTLSEFEAIIFGGR